MSHQRGQPITEPMQLKVNLSGDVAEVLRAYADEHGVTVSEAVRDAIETFHYLRQEIKQGGVTLIRYPSGKQIRMIWPWER